MEQERKVCYMIYNKERDSFDLYLNYQNYDKEMEDWEYRDKLDYNLVCSVPCVRMENDTTRKDAEFIHWHILKEISDLVYYGYIYLGTIDYKGE